MSLSSNDLFDKIWDTASMLIYYTRYHSHWKNVIEDVEMMLSIQKCGSNRIMKEYYSSNHIFYFYNLTDILVGHGSYIYRFSKIQIIIDYLDCPFLMNFV